MALVATAYPQTRPSWVDDEAIIKRQEENQELINVFLRMWDGKVGVLVSAFRRFRDDSATELTIGSFTIF